MRPALQVDEFAREIDDDILQIRQCADKAEATERRAREETARADDLARQLDEERRDGAMSRLNSPAFAGRRSNVRRRRSARWRCNRPRTKLPPPCCGARLR